MKILIIEDDLIIAQNLKENLEEVGYQVTSIATNATEALHELREETPDVCLVDIYLKGSSKNGIEIVSEVRSSVDIPYIYLTSFDDHEFREKAKGTNPAGYLIKPATKEQVDVAIDFAMTSFLRNKASEQGSAMVSQHCPLQAVDDMLFIKSNGKYVKVRESDIIYLEASGPYTYIYSVGRKSAVSLNLKRLLEQILSIEIIKCHRSYAVNKSYVYAFDDNTLYLEGGAVSEAISVPISRRHKEHVMLHFKKLKG